MNKGAGKEEMNKKVKVFIFAEIIYGLKNMMKDVGVNDDKVFFLEMQSYLKESNVMRKIINVSDSEKKPKKKTWIFGKGR
jgi:hypothetical protein